MSNFSAGCVHGEEVKAEVSMCHGAACEGQLNQVSQENLDPAALKQIQGALHGLWPPSPPTPQKFNFDPTLGPGKFCAKWFIWFLLWKCLLLLGGSGL